MRFTDPFWGYSFLLRAIVYVAIPAFGVVQFVRLRRALHVFQLEGYKRARFLEWCRSNPSKARWLSSPTAKKPLAMTGRAWRLLASATALSLVAVLVVPALAHLFLGGWPADVIAWTLTTVLVLWQTARVLVVADVLLAPIQRAINARYLRAATRRLADVSPTVIGVTGSFGKTSTKFAIAGLLGPDGVLATPGSFNTPLGVCRTINERLERSHRYFVVEMGAYAVGEIAELCRFVHHRIGVLTAIGPAHLDRFGSMDAIRKAKYEIVATLPDDGIAVMNVDDPDVRALADDTTRVRVIRYGLEPDGRPEISATDVDVGARGTVMTIVDSESGRRMRVETRLLGRHALGHVLAAVAVAKALGRPLEEARTTIESLRPVEHRLQVIEGTGGVTVIDDAYNSNPQGAAAALEVLEAMPGNRKVVVTPGIIEMGELQTDANREFGKRAAQVADVLIVVAKLNRDALTAGAARADGARVIAVDSLDEAQQYLARVVSTGDVVLFENDLPDQYEN